LNPDKSGQHCEKDILSDIQPNPQKIGWSSVYIMLTTTVLIMYVHALVDIYIDCLVSEFRLGQVGQLI